ncbi:MAG: transposase [Sphingomonadales bacterium]|nr:transposase [Sphingomonadales bacterium]
MGRITVFAGPERRRRWSDEQRLLILTEAFAPDAHPCDVARRHEISTGQLYTWRKKLAVGPAGPAQSEDAGHGPRFAEAVVISDHDSATQVASAAIVVDLPRGRRITIFPIASPALAAAALRALR